MILSFYSWLQAFTIEGNHLSSISSKQLDQIIDSHMFSTIENVQRLYESGKYDQAIQAARSSKNNYSNPKLHLIWAKSAQALGLVTEAMNAYERVVILDESNTEAKMELIKIYSLSKRSELLMSVIESLQESQLTPEQKKLISDMKYKELNTIKSSASIVFGYDSNINVSPGSDVLDEYFNVTGSLDKASTYFAKLFGKITYIDEIESKGGWYLRGDMSAFHQNNFNQSAFNMFLGSLEAGSGYKSDGYSVYVPLSYDYIYYLEQSLFTQFKIKPKLNMQLSKEYIASLGLNYSKRMFSQQESFINNDISKGISASLFYLFDKNSIYLTSKYEAYKPDSTNPSKFVDKTLLHTSVGINYNLYQEISTKIDYKYRLAKYAGDIGNVFTLDDTKRVDQFHQIEFRLSNDFSKKFKLYLSTKYIKNNSNYIPAQHDKYIAMFGLNMSY